MKISDAKLEGLRRVLLTTPASCRRSERFICYMQKTLLLRYGRVYFSSTGGDNKLRLVTAEKGTELAASVKLAHTFWSRFYGLALRGPLPAGSCLHLQPCTRIHTYFMRYAIDVLYLNKEQAIVGMELGIPPRCLGQRFPGTASVLEFPAGKLDLGAIPIGSTVEFIN